MTVPAEPLLSMLTHRSVQKPGRYVKKQLIWISNIFTTGIISIKSRPNRSYFLSDGFLTFLWQTIECTLCEHSIVMNKKWNKRSFAPLKNAIFYKTTKKSNLSICQNQTLQKSAGSRTWTGTELPPRDFKSLASAYSAIPAYKIIISFKRNDPDGTRTRDLRRDRAAL